MLDKLTLAARAASINLIFILSLTNQNLIVKGKPTLFLTNIHDILDICPV